MIPNYQCPLNEFTEHCTGDMPSMDTAWHYWLQPKYDEAREKWERAIVTMPRHAGRTRVIHLFAELKKRFRKEVQ